MKKKVSITDLKKDWLVLKSQENNLKAKRLVVEEQLAKLMPGPDEGTEIVKDGGYDISVTRKFKREIDLKIYMKIKSKLTTDPLIIGKPKIDLKVLKAIETAGTKKQIELIQKFITVKPAKPAVKIVEEKKK